MRLLWLVARLKNLRNYILKRSDYRIARAEVAVDHLDMNPVDRERGGDFPNLDNGLTTQPALRKVDMSGVGMRGAPAILALDDPAPQRNAANHTMEERRAQGLCSPGVSGEIASYMTGISCPMDPTLATLSGCGVASRLLVPDVPERKNRSVAGCLKLTARRPDVPMGDARKADLSSRRDDAPGSPSDDRLGIVGRRHSASTFCGSAVFGTGTSLGTCDGSRRTGSSSGSTV